MKKNKTLKKLLALIMAASMVLSTFAGVSFASEAQEDIQTETQTETSLEEASEDATVLYEETEDTTTETEDEYSDVTPETISQVSTEDQTEHEEVIETPEATSEETSGEESTEEEILVNSEEETSGDEQITSEETSEEGSSEAENQEEEMPEDDKLTQLQEKMNTLPDIVLDGSASSEEEELEQYYAAMEMVDSIQAEIDELTDEEYDQLDFTRFAAYATMVYSMYQPINNIAVASLGGASNALDSSTVTVTVASEVWLIPNIGCWDYYFELSNGAVAYCGEALSTHPGTGTTVSISEYTGSNAELMKKILYYGSDGAGAVLSSSQVDRARTGFALSYAYSGADVEHVYSMGGISEYSGTGARFASQVSGYSAVPSSYKLYMCSCGSGYQVLFYLSYEPEGYVTLTKSTSSDTSIHPLTGAVYGIYSDSLCTTWKGYFITGAAGTGYVAKWTTNKIDIPSAAGDCYNYYNGYYYYADTYDQTITLDEGTYYLREEAAPSGYKKNTGTYQFAVSAGSTTALTSTATSILSDELSDGYLYIQKSSANADICKDNNLYSLKGAEYKVYSSTSLAESNLVATLTTDENGKTETVKLAEGRYYVVESKASLGHRLDPDATAPYYYAVNLTASNTQDNPYVLKSTDPIETDPIRIRVSKDSSENYMYALPLAGAMFKIYYYDNLAGDHSGTPKRTWKITTKLESATGKYATQLSDEYLTSDSDPLYYVDGEARLLLGTYTIEEIRPADGYSLKGSMYFTGDEAGSVSTDGGMLVKVIDSDSILNPVQSKNSINGYNTPVIIDTEALINGIHYADADMQMTTITDRVSLSNINPGGTYRLTGTLYNQATGEILMTKVVDFTASAESQTVNVDFTVDTAAYIGKHLVAGEILEQYVNGTWYKMGEEMDLTVKKQMVHFPSVSTMLKDNVTNSNIAEAGNATFVDTVTYTGLVSGSTYTLNGKLLDKATGEVVATSSSAFVAAASTSTTTLSFNFTAEENHTYVAYEYVSSDGSVIAKHENINDESQTVYVPSIDTTLKDTVDEDKDAYATDGISLTDVVTYKNLIVGKTYTVTGILYDKATGETVTDDNGKTITATTRFTPGQSDGKVEITFVFSGTRLAGRSVVAFETVSYRGIEVAVHADINDTDQTVNLPAIKTTLTDQINGEHDAFANETATLVDTVSYTNLLAGREYKLSGVLIDRATGLPALDDNGKEITSEASFKAESADGTVNVTYTFSGQNLKGHTLVAYEELTRNGKTVAVHKEISDAEQTVYIPEISTNLKDSMDSDNDAFATENVVLTDTVTYRNLIIGKSYKLEAKLYDKATGETAKDDNGQEITATSEFTAENAAGSIDVTFTFSGVSLAGKTVVAFEDLYTNGKKVATHSNLEDEDQTVYIPKIKTSLADVTDGEKDAYATGEITLVDTVTYENLIIGKEYKVTGKLMDQSTGEAILDDNGEEITSETSFTAEKADGNVEVTFKFSGISLAGRSIVAFEDLYKGEKQLAAHADINDKAQTVDIPEIRTTLMDSVDAGKDAFAEGTPVVLTDTVTYKNLHVGETYTLTGVLIDKATGEAALDDDGNEITAETTFTAESSEGSVDVVFTFNGTSLKGETVVAFEDLYRGAKHLAAHAEIDDEEQSVYIPKITTSLTDIADGGKHVEAAEEVTLVDTITYKNLIPGTEYTAVGLLYDKSTNSPATDDNGDQITCTVKFTAEEADGATDLTFSFPAVSMKNTTLVAVEKVYRGEKCVAIHADIEDYDQSVFIPEIGTTLTEKESGLHNAYPYEVINLTDTVEYKNLIVGHTYTISGILMDKATGETFKDAEGNEITAVSEFVPEAADGTAKITFVIKNVPQTAFAVVAAETLYENGKKIAIHADIDDYNQTVFVSKLSTSLVGTKDNKLISGLGTITLTDTVEYKELDTNVEYTLTGELMDKETGEAFKDKDGNAITSTVTFTPSESEGSVEVIFTIDAYDDMPRAAVAFETLYLGETVAADHKELDDEAQTVTFLNLKTKAAFKNGGKEDFTDKNQTVVDEITYDRLMPGTYTIVTSLVSKETSKAITTVSNIRELTDAAGTVKIELDIPANKITGDAVVFEEFYLQLENGEKILVGEHKDLNDENQTITFRTPERTPETGDINGTAPYLALGIIALMAFLVGGIILIRKRRTDRQQ